MTGALVTTCSACGSADCRVAFWADIVKRGAWAGRAVSYESMERDSIRIAERCAEIERLEKERA